MAIDTAMGLDIATGVDRRGSPGSAFGVDPRASPGRLLRSMPSRGRNYGNLTPACLTMIAYLASSR